MASHARQPSEEQLRPLVQSHFAFWKRFNKSVFYSAIAIAGLLVFLGLTLIGVKHG